MKLSKFIRGILVISLCAIVLCGCDPSFHFCVGEICHGSFSADMEAILQESGTIATDLMIVNSEENGFIVTYHADTLKIRSISIHTCKISEQLENIYIEMEEDKSTIKVQVGERECEPEDASYGTLQTIMGVIDSTDIELIMQNHTNDQASVYTITTSGMYVMIDEQECGNCTRYVYYEGVVIPEAEYEMLSFEVSGYFLPICFTALDENGDPIFDDHCVVVLIP